MNGLKATKRDDHKYKKKLRIVDFYCIYNAPKALTLLVVSLQIDGLMAAGLHQTTPLITFIRVNVGRNSCPTAGFVVPTLLSWTEQHLTDEDIVFGRTNTL